MEVETYEVLETETGEQAPEMQAEAIELIREMELEGQEELLTEDGSERNPYRLMTAEEERVYGVLCDTVTPLPTYRAGPIPLRVLQVAAHARSLFTHLYVLHPKDRPDDDPVLVGSNEEKRYSGLQEPHILARWGSVLRPFEELKEMARAKWISKQTAQMRKKIAECESFVAGIDGHAEDYLSGEYVTVP